MKKNQKIKKVRRLHRGKASLQRGLSFFFDSVSVVYERALATNRFTKRFSKYNMTPWRHLPGFVGCCDSLENQ